MLSFLLQAQFVIIIIYMGTLLMAKCELPRFLSWYTIAQAFVFFLLFANFYVRTYIVGSKKTAKENSSITAGPSSSLSSSPIAHKSQNGRLLNGAASKLKAN